MANKNLNAYCDCRPEASSGFTGTREMPTLAVDFPPALLEQVPTCQREGLLGVLAQDPRPRYQNDPGRVYGMSFAGQNIRFRVEGDTLHVCGVGPETE